MKTLNTTLLAKLVRQHRKHEGKSLRAAAEGIPGLSYSTLARIESGAVPDAENFLRICDWLGKSADLFYKPRKTKSRLFIQTETPT